MYKRIGEKNMKRFLLILFLLFSNSYLHCGTFIDTVYSFIPGTVQSAGQSPEYFPNNIFGPPSRLASWTIPESRPEELCSIGIGGEITVGLKNGVIRNGEGVDFIIFENAFQRLIDGKIFAEPAIVSVSQDGVNFIVFPYNEWTLEGMAGKTPTNGQISPFDYPDCGGDGFDLSVVGLDYITHIKIKDVSLIVTINATHPYYQPQFLVSGFDLDAISILYPDYSSIIDLTDEKPSIQELKDRFVVNIDKGKVYVYNLQGVLVYSIEANSLCEIPKSKLPKGFLIFSIYDFSNNKKITRKFINFY